MLKNCVRDSNALRAKRCRKHKAGDHSLCHPECHIRPPRVPRGRAPCSGCGKPMPDFRGAAPAGKRMCHPCRRLRLAAEGKGNIKKLRRAGPEKECVECGKTFQPSNTGQTACSITCSAAARRARGAYGVTHTCPICGTQYWLNCGGQRTCSRSCGQILRIRNSTPRAPKPRIKKARPARPCTVCGTPMPQHKRSYCTQRCRVIASGVRVMDLYALACAQGAGGKQWRGLLVRYLKERDGTHCQICHKPINYTLKAGPHGHPSGKGPSIDHVIPRSQGGNDDLSNTGAATVHAKHAAATNNSCCSDRPVFFPPHGWGSHQPASPKLAFVRDVRCERSW